MTALLLLHSNILCRLCFKTTRYRFSLRALVRNELDRLIEDLKGIEQGVALLQSVVPTADHIAPFAGLGTACFTLSREFSDRKQGLFPTASKHAKARKAWGRANGVVAPFPGYDA